MSRIARVVVDLSLDRGFDYLIPEPLLGQVHVGVQVKVPFGNSVRLGYVLSILENSDYQQELKPIQSVSLPHTRIPEPLIKLGRWMAEYYCCSREQTIRTLLPRAVRSGKVKHHTLKYYSIADTNIVEKFIIDNAAHKGNAKQVQILKTLLPIKSMELEQLLGEAKGSAATIGTLLKKKLICEEKRVVRRDPYADVSIMPTLPQIPTAEQSAALNTIAAMLAKPDQKHTILIHGVTGSGKTEIYLQAIASIIEQDKEAIVLVPEISLTPQTVRRFRARFGDMVSVIHSRLTEGERFDEWSKINDGLVKIVIGARSALFAPFRKLGLIVVDEEHDNSYKQSEAPRYHARDVAIMRGMIENAVVILGSATPSFESYTNAVNGKYHLAELKQRVENRFLPTVNVVDYRLDANEPGQSNIITKILREAVAERLKRGEQTILFLNRRGYARQMLCECCGFVAECPDCSVAYTYHRQRQTLSCHLCGDVIPAHQHCPECNSEEIRYSGSGTEKIEAMIGAIFKGARIIRMDSDTMRKISSYEEALEKFGRGDADILVGTQMIAKGLDFPNVTLVGIINADHGLHIPDFRACERTFQMLTQVAGRAGRGDIHGEVIIQTFNPNNETIQLAIQQDFVKFYEYDMDVRKMLSYPPAGHLIAVHFKGEIMAEVSAAANQFMEKIRPFCHDGIVVSEPAPAPIERIKGKYRFQIILRGAKLKQLREKIRQIVLHEARIKNVEVYVDVDAQSLM
jgi:primosomal protein N' (replication factor Y)